MSDRKEREKNGTFTSGNLGRRRGSKNKIPADVARMVLDVVEELGGKEALLKWASNPRNETVFWTRMVAPLMPKTFDAQADIGLAELDNLPEEVLRQMAMLGESGERNGSI